MLETETFTFKRKTSIHLLFRFDFVKDHLSKIPFLFFSFFNREDTYVRVAGYIKSFQETRSVIAFNITPIRDFNELTYHLLDVIHSHLAISKVRSNNQFFFHY